MDGGVGGGHASPLSPLKGPIANMNYWMKIMYLYYGSAFVYTFFGYSYLTALFPVAVILGTLFGLSVIWSLCSYPHFEKKLP